MHAVSCRVQTVCSFQMPLCLKWGTVAFYSHKDWSMSCLSFWSNFLTEQSEQENVFRKATAFTTNMETLTVFYVVLYILRGQENRTEKGKRQHCAQQNEKPHLWNKRLQRTVHRALDMIWHNRGPGQTHVIVPNRYWIKSNEENKSKNKPANKTKSLTSQSLSSNEKGKKSW